MRNWPYAQDVETRLGDVIAGFINGLLLEGSSTDSDLSEHLHDLIFELYSAVPKILYSVIPNIEIDLQVELLEKRKQAVQLAAKLFLCQSGLLMLQRGAGRGKKDNG